MKFYTSDHHFYHANIIRFCDRPFQDIQEMEEEYVSAWNNQVNKQDEVYHLGDFAFRSKNPRNDVNRVLSRLNGHIHLIKGNHDHRKTFDCTFTSVKDYDYVTHYGQKIVLFHYPIASWRSMKHGTWQLYGHCHGSYQNHGKSIDVGIDVHKKLLTFEDVREIMNQKEIETVDHH